MAIIDHMYKYKNIVWWIQLKFLPYKYNGGYAFYYP